MSSPVALVTGVSSGIGNATARMLIERGYRVFGTARSKSSPMPAKVERVLLDVRDAASIEPGFMRTNIGENRLLPGSVADAYAAARDRAGESIRTRVSAGEDPSVVAQAVLEAATAEKPRLRYPVGKGAGLLARLRRYL